LLLTDGDDDASKATRDVAVVAAQVAGVVIFSLDTSEGQTTEKGAKALRELSSKTGDEVIRLRGQGMKKSLAQVAEEIGSMYGITFAPVNSGGANRHHRFELKLLPGKKLKLRAPQGYYVP
jgi:hypothetical protein